jgi:Zn finger protein HypA/HybF involved in hydrogenase expression
VSNIDHWVGGALAHDVLITARHRQPSVTESPVTLPPKCRESVVSSTQQFLTAIERLRCPRCQTRMMLERVSPGPIGFEQRLFECPKCNEVEISVIASDPFKSKAAGWLDGELTAPN